MYITALNLPAAYIRATKGVDTIMLSPTGVGPEELQGVFMPFFKRLEDGLELWCHHTGSQVFNRGGLGMCTLDMHDRNHFVGVPAHGGWCHSCETKAANYGEFPAQAPLRTVESQKEKHYQLTQALEGVTNEKAQAKLMSQFGARPYELPFWENSVDLYSMTITEMMHLELLGNMKHRAWLIIGYLGTRGELECDTQIENFQWPRGSLVIPKIRYWSHNMPAVKWTSCAKFLGFIFARVLSNPQNLKPAVKKKVSSMKKPQLWSQEVLRGWFLECERQQLLRMREKKAVHIQRAHEILLELKQSDSKIYPKSATKTPNLHSAEHVMRGEMEVGIASSTSADTGEKMHQSHKQNMSGTNYRNEAPQLLEMSNVDGTLLYMAQGGPFALPNGVVITAGKDVQEMADWPIFKKEPAPIGTRITEGICEDGSVLSFIDRRENRSIKSFNLFPYRTPLQTFYNRMGRPFMGEGTGIKFYRFRHPAKEFDVQGARGDYVGDDVMMEQTDPAQKQIHRVYPHVCNVCDHYVL